MIRYNTEVNILKYHTKKMFHELLILTLIQQVMSENYPQFYALDIGDGQGMQLLASWGKNCPFYRSKISVLLDGLYLYKSANVWYISKGGSYETRSSGCPIINRKGKVLFTLPSPRDLPHVNGWYNITKANLIGDHYDENVNLYLRKVDACTIYRNAYFKFTSRVGPTQAENFDVCKEKAKTEYMKNFFQFLNDYYLISSRTDDSKTTCLFARKNKVKGSIVQDPNGKFFIIGDECSSVESRIVNTEDWKEAERSSRSEEKDVNSENSTANEISENSKSDDKTIVVVIGAGGGGVLILVLAICALFRCRKKRAEKSGNRESVDLNHQYGAEEYYEYSKHGTNVVDENDQYNYGDYDDE